MKRILNYTASTLVIAILLVACSRGSDSTNLYGTWILQELNGLAIPSSMEETSMDFKSDGTVILGTLQEQMVGTWLLSDSMLSVTFNVAELYDNMGINDPSLQTTVTHDYIIDSIAGDRMVLELQGPMSLKQVFVRL